MEQLRVEGSKDVSFISIFDRMKQEDILLHTPYQSYDTVLRFFNEAAIDSEVAEIYTTMYRVAKDSRIAQALMTASRNGKKVDRKSTRLNSSHVRISYAVFCLKKKN